MAYSRSLEKLQKRALAQLPLLFLPHTLMAFFVHHAVIALHAFGKWPLIAEIRGGSRARSISGDKSGWGGEEVGAH